MKRPQYVQQFPLVQQEINTLKAWSNLDQFQVIFDSDEQGDGSENVLLNSVYNKNQLYFITIDDNGNMFGGYVSTYINHVNEYTSDNKSFIFSLKRKGITKNKKYFLKKGLEDVAFYLYSNSDTLYQFGGYDVVIHKVGSFQSYCLLDCYNCFNEQTPLNTPYTNPFTVNRLLVIRMY
ncbi:TLDc domain-containing protein [Entamoeba marina]